MTINTLNLLINSGLIEASGKGIDTNKIPVQELQSRLQQYYDSRYEYIDTDLSFMANTQGLSAQFGTLSTRKSILDILTSSLVYSHLVIDDPLLTDNPTLRIADIQDGIDYISSLYPLIKSGFISIFPISFLTRAQDEIPLFVSEDNFKSAIPTNVHDFIHKKAILKSTVWDQEKKVSYILTEDAHVSKRAAINVFFEDDIESFNGVGYFTYDTNYKAKDEDGNDIFFHAYDPERILTYEEFEPWAYQVVNRSIMVRLRDISNEIQVANRIGHTYITDSQFEAEMLGLASMENYSEQSPAVNFLKTNHEFITIESPMTILKVRDKYPLAFQRFNSTLLGMTEALDSIPADVFEKKAEQLFIKEVLPQIDEVKSCINSIYSGAGQSTLTSFAGISIAIASGSIPSLALMCMMPLPSTLIGTLKGLRTYQEYKKKPQFIWHKLSK